MAKPQSEVRTTAQGLESGGRLVILDEIPAQVRPLKQTPTTVRSRYADYMPDETVDYSDLKRLVDELGALRSRLYGTSNELDKARREMVRTKREWQHARNRALLGISGGTDATRNALADLQTEDSYSAYLVAQTVFDEINQRSRDVRTDLDALKELSNNTRRQMDMGAR